MNTLVKPLVRVRIRDDDTPATVPPGDEPAVEYDRPLDLADTQYRLVMICRGGRDATSTELHNNQQTIRPKTVQLLKKEVKS